MHIHQIIIQKWFGSFEINRKIPEMKWLSPLEYHKIFTENHSDVRTQTRKNIEMVSISYWRKNFLSFSLVQLFPNRILKYLRIIENWIHRKILNLRSFRLLFWIYWQLKSILQYPNKKNWQLQHTPTHPHQAPLYTYIYPIHGAVFPPLVCFVSDSII